MDVLNDVTLDIAHRLSTIRFASRIVSIEEGVVAESGTHDALCYLIFGDA